MAAQHNVLTTSELYILKWLEWQTSYVFHNLKKLYRNQDCCLTL